METQSAKLEKQEEKDLQYYREYLDGLAKKNPVSSEIFSNKGKVHASILMATLLINTEHRLDMYCQGLRPGILCGKDENDEDGYRGAYWKAFKDFFNTSIKSGAFGKESVRILIQDEQWINNMPFKVVGKALRDNVTKDKVIVKIISSQARDLIEQSLGKKENTNYNFSIYDDNAFRLEYEPDDYLAIGSFNDPSWCNLLREMFNYAFSNAVDITDKVRDLEEPMI